jgi:DNA-binding NarL/FixJ family response regulator
MSPHALIVDDVAGNQVEQFLCKCIPGLAGTVVKSVPDMRGKLGNQTSPFDWLFLNVHCGLGTRSVGGILPLLEELVTKPDGTPRLVLYGYETDRKRALGRGVAEHPLLTDKFLNTWTYLSMPILLEDTKKELKQSKPLDSNVRSAVAQVRASRLDREIRHKMAGATAAVRILNGALRSGDYDLQDNSVRVRFDAAFKSLREACIRSGLSDSQADIGELILAARIGAQAVEERPEKTRKAQATEGKTQQKKELLPGRQLLIVDDEKAVWEPVWKFLLNTDTVSFAITGKDALSMVQSHGTSYDAVILDLDLGKGKMTGVETLQHIKHNHLDLPVIVATAVDHADVTKQCLRLGASSYFVKELGESNRDSVQYYRALVETLAHEPGQGALERRLWQEFTAIESAVEDVDKTFGTSIGRYFRKAYYLVTLDDDHVLPSELLVIKWSDSNKSDKYAEAIHQAVKAADEIIISKYLMAHPGKTYSDGSTAIFAPINENRNRGNEKRWPTLLERYGRAWPSKNMVAVEQILKAQEAGRAVNLVRKAGTRHAYRFGSETPEDMQTAILCLRIILNLAREVLPKVFPVTTAIQPIVPVSLEGFSIAQRDFSHEEKTEHSATILLEGFRRAQASSGQSPQLISGARPKVLFIDDQADHSPWYIALKEIFESWKIGLCVVPNLDDDRDLKAYILILLDLVFYGDARKGLSLLQVIKKKDPFVPVVMLTAERSALFCRNALFRGANGYFVKDASFDHDPEAYYKYFASTVSHYLQSQCALARTRLLWNHAQEIKIDNFAAGLSLGDREWKQIKLIKQLPSDMDKEQILNRIRDMTLLPIQEAVFHYALIHSPEIFLDLWKVKRLISPGGGYEIALAVGQMVEFLMWQLYEFRRLQPSTKEKAGRLIDELLDDNPLRQELKKLWDARTTAKSKRSPSIENIDRQIYEAIEVAKRFRFNMGLKDLNQIKDRKAEKRAQEERRVAVKHVEKTERRAQGGQGNLEGPHSGKLAKLTYRGNGKMEGLLIAKNNRKYPVTTNASIGDEDPFTFNKGDEVQFYTRCIPGNIHEVVTIKKIVKNPP